jgi:Protein of unknown function (DUF3500)
MQRGRLTRKEVGSDSTKGFAHFLLTYQEINMHQCQDCSNSADLPVSRRGFVQTVSVAAASAVVAVPQVGVSDEPNKPASESLVTKLYNSLTPTQKKSVCFDWDHKDDRGLLRMHVSNNWQITGDHKIATGFYTKDQQEMIEALFWGLYSPDWHDRIKKQLQDDAGGYGKEQSIAIFGQPGTGKFEFVMTGRHLTIRCDGNSVEHVAFGGPIFYGHAASGFDERVGHPGNVYWYQAQKANSLFQMLNGKQREQALVEQAPEENKVHFGGPDGRPQGIIINELSSDQKEYAQKVLDALVEPYRTTDRDEVFKCLKAQGGLDKCRLAFYKSDDLGNDGEWDNWRLEGPSFVWHYRGTPHVHVWVNVADHPAVKITTGG